METSVTKDLTRTTFAVLLIGVLIFSCFWILRPFLPALIWASMIVVSTWPLLLSVQTRLGNRRAPAVAVMTFTMLLIFVIPFSLAIGTIVEQGAQLKGWIGALHNFSFPPAPAWLIKIPLAGSQLTGTWQQLASLPPEELGGRLTPYLGKAVSLFLTQAGSFGVMFVTILLTLILSGFLYANGESAANSVLKLARRIAGSAGQDAARLAGNAVRAVALGVVVTALVQAVLAGIGMAVAGVPYPTLLTALIFVLTIAQIGPAPVLIAAVAWLFWSDASAAGTGLLIWALLVSGIDNFLRPLLIRRGANLPLILIFAGVIGGLLAFGVVGLFIGPVVLAVAYTLLEVWVNDSDNRPVTTGTDQ
jgi:predicted PurR-regulated permease PerM